VRRAVVLEDHLTVGESDNFDLARLVRHRKPRPLGES
jgi:hypothetical protein